MGGVGGEYANVVFARVTLESTNSAEQSVELDFSTRSESKRMGQEKGGCVKGGTHTHTHQE